MLRPSPRLMLRPTTMATMDLVPTVVMDWELMATATPPTPDTDTTTARGPLMLRPSPRLRLMPRPTTTVATDWELTATDTVPMAMATPPTPDMDTTTVRGLLMLRPSPRLMLRLTTMVAMDSVPTVAMDWELMATDTVPTAMATPPMAMEPTTTARGPLMLRPSPRLMLRPTTMATMDLVPTVVTDWELMATDTVLMAMATPPTPDTDTTTARGPLML